MGAQASGTAAQGGGQIPAAVGPGPQGGGGGYRAAGPGPQGGGGGRRARQQMAGQTPADLASPSPAVRTQATAQAAQRSDTAMKNATVAAQTGAGVPTKLQVFKQIAPSANIPGVSTPAGQALTNTTSYLQHLASQTGSQGKPVLTLQQRMQKVDTAYGAGQQKAAAADAAAAKTAPAPAPATPQGAAGVATAAGAGAVPDWILKSQAQNAAAKAANDALRAKQVAENNAVKQNYLQQQAQRQAARKAPAPAAAPATAPVAQAPAPAFAPAGAPTAKQQQAVSKATTVKQLTQGGTVQQAGANLAAKPGATPAPAIPTVATVSPALR